MGGKNWWEISGVSKSRRFEKSGVKLQPLTEANPREIVPRFEKSGGLKNRGLEKSGFHCNCFQVTSIAIPFVSLELYWE